MFIVFNKEKIASYIILLSTVIILFGIGFSIAQQDTIATSTNTIQNNIDNTISQILENTMKDVDANAIEEMIKSTGINVINDMQINEIIGE